MTVDSLDKVLEQRQIFTTLLYGMSTEVIATLEMMHKPQLQIGYDLRALKTIGDPLRKETTTGNHLLNDYSYVRMEERTNTGIIVDCTFFYLHSLFGKW